MVVVVEVIIIMFRIIEKCKSRFGFKFEMFLIMLLGFMNYFFFGFFSGVFIFGYFFNMVVFR